MTRPLPQVNRFFVSPEFSIYYRRTKQLSWQNQATSGYSLLATLSGKVDYSIDGSQHTLPESEIIVLEPNTNMTARGHQVVLLFLTISASLVIQHATSLRLIPPKSIVTFTGDHIHGDRRLDSLLNEFVSELATEKPGKEIVMRALDRK